MINQRGNDLAEGAADDDTDGQIDDIAAHGKSLELTEHAHASGTPLIEPDGGSL
jgi:hypothetical protein